MVAGRVKRPEKMRASLTIVNSASPIVRMRSLLIAVLLAVAAPLALAADVDVAFRVKAPASTPADAKLYLAGDAEALGAWAEDGLELKKGDDGVYAARVKLPV